MLLQHGYEPSAQGMIDASPEIKSTIAAGIPLWMSTAVVTSFASK